MNQSSFVKFSRIDYVRREGKFVKIGGDISYYLAMNYLNKTMISWLP